VRVLRHAQGHLSAAQIADQVRDVYPFVDVSTVYRTLDVLKRMKRPTATDMGAGDVLFEWAPEEPHHHLICSSCGDVVQLEHSYLTCLSGHESTWLRTGPPPLRHSAFAANAGRGVTTRREPRAAICGAPNVVWRRGPAGLRIRRDHRTKQPYAVFPLT
jgi:hypothetical protein